jgi:hypothetical protein
MSVTHRQNPYKALDNGFLSCAEPGKLQLICDALGPEETDRVFRKWLRRIPLPLRPEDREAGYDWDLSIWQMEVSLTQIFDRPLRGREFFEEVIRDNLDLGRPDRVQLIFDRAVTKKTPGEFRTRVIQEGVHPSLHISYKNSDLKQHFKEGRGCRTEGTFRNPNDFGSERRLSQPAVLAEDRPTDQSALAGSRTRQPQQRLERRQHPTRGATCRNRRRQEGAWAEVRPTAGDGAAAGAHDVPSPHRRLSQSRSSATGGRLAGGHAGRIHSPPHELRLAAAPAEGFDPSPTESQSLLRQTSSRLMGGRSPDCSRGWRRVCFAPQWPSSPPPTPFCPSHCAKYMCRRYCCIPFAPHNWLPDFEYGRIEKYSGRHEGECA